MGIGAGGQKTSAVMTDPTTGQQYVVKTDPSTGNVTKVNVEGATGLTFQQKEEIKGKEETLKQDYQNAMLAGNKAFDAATQIDTNIRDLSRMATRIEEGAETGLIRNLMPSFDMATADLRTMANKMGINILSMVTFGALSEKELELAMRTAIDTSLETPELMKLVRAKIAAQSKLRNALYDKASYLAGGDVRYSKFITETATKAKSDKMSMSDKLKKIKSDRGL